MFLEYSRNCRFLEYLSQLFYAHARDVRPCDRDENAFEVKGAYRNCCGNYGGLRHTCRTERDGQKLKVNARSATPAIYLCGTN